MENGHFGQRFFYTIVFVQHIKWFAWKFKKIVQQCERWQLDVVGQWFCIHEPGWHWPYFDLELLVSRILNDFKSQVKPVHVDGDLA